MSNLFTICIPTYNRASLLEETLESFIQDGAIQKNIPFVISDNGSADHTEAVARKFTERGLAIRYHKNAENLGFSKNVIQAVEMAETKYVWFFGDDDLIPAGTIERIHSELTAHQPTIAYLNHQGFSIKRVGWASKPAHPWEDRMFEDGYEFFSNTGLGFLSALIVKRDDFIRRLDKVVPSRNNAHIEIAARIALQEKGPFLLLGTVCVKALIDATSISVNNLIDGFVTVHLIYSDLVAEGLLPAAHLQKWKRRSVIYEILPRSIYYRCYAPHRFAEGLPIIEKHFGDDPAYPWTVGIATKLPKALIFVPYVCAHWIVTRTRLPLHRLLKAISSGNRS